MASVLSCPTINGGQKDTFRRNLLDSTLAVNHRNVLALCPKRCKIAVMGRARIARLTRRIDPLALVPIADVDNDPHRSAEKHLEVGGTVRSHHRRAVPAPLRQRT